jgi:hypothetical protein
MYMAQFYSPSPAMECLQMKDARDMLSYIEPTHKMNMPTKELSQTYLMSQVSKSVAFLGRTISSHCDLDLSYVAIEIVRVCMKQ